MAKYSDAYRNALLYIKNIIKVDTKPLFIYIFFVACVSGIQALLPFIARLETDQLVQKNQELWGISLSSPFFVFILISGIVASVTILENLLNLLKTFFEQTSTVQLEQRYVSSLILRLSDMPLGKYLNKRNQKFISSFRSGNLLTAIRTVFVDTVFVNIIRFSGIVVAFMSLNMYIFVPMILTILVSLLLDATSESRSRKYQLQAQYTHDHKLPDIKRYLVYSFDKVVSSGGGETTMKIYNDLIAEKITFEKQRSKEAMGYSFFGSLNNIFGGFVVKLIVAYIIFSGGATVGVMTMAIMYVSQIKSFFRASFSTKHKRDTMIDEFKRLDLYLKMTTPGSASCAKSELVPIPTYNELKTLSINHLTFAYPKISPEELEAYQIMIKRLQSYGEKKISELIKDNISFMQDAFDSSKKPPVPVLKDVSYTFEKGKVYGIVGYNGAGKTTLMTLIMDYFPEYKGDILYNTTNLKTVDSASCPNLFSVIMQDPFIFYFLSIRDNLLLGVNKIYSDEELFVYLAEFHLEEKVRKMRKGLDSTIGYDSEFSGGEKQLLVLIRVLLQDRPILIIDEGTGQLDAQNEMRIMKKLLKKKHEKIIIFIAHRMSVMKHVDTILCMEQGRIIDIGTPKELLSRPSLYKTFWDYQIGV